MLGRAVCISSFAFVLWALPGAALAFDWSGRIDLLADGLESPSPSARRQTLERLGTYPAPQVAEHLVAALSDDDPDVRMVAARLAGRGRLREAVPPLMGWLSEPEEEARIAACRALGQIRDGRAVGPLSRALNDSDASVRRAAVEALTSVGTDGAIIPLVGRLGDSHPRVREAAARGLGELSASAAVVPLISRIQDPVQPVRSAVIGALARIGDERASAAMLQALRDPSPSVRATALSALARLRCDELVIPAVGLLGDDNEEVRRRSVAALGAIGSERAIEALVELLGNQTLAPTAAAALAEVGAPAVPRLCDVLRRGSDERARSAALGALMNIGSPAAADAIVEELATGPGVPEASLVTALGSIRSERGLLALIERVDAEEATVRRSALIALSRYLTRGRVEPRAGDALVSAARAEAEEERLLAMLLLARTGEPRALDVATTAAREGARGTEGASRLLAMLPTSDEGGLRAEVASAIATGWPLRAAGIRVLGACREPDAAPVLLELLGHRHGALRNEAAIALGRLGGDGVVTGLTERLRSEEPLDRSASILALGTALAGAPSDDGRHTLEALLEGGDTTLALRAADALARAGSAESVPALEGLLARPQVALRRKAVEALGEIGGPAAGLALQRALSDEDPLVRGLAAWGLGKVGGEGTATALAEGLGDRGWSVGINSAGALARLADPATADAVCDALDGGARHHFRVNLLLAAAATGAACALPEAMEAMRESPSPLVRSAAARVIGGFVAGAPEPGADDVEGAIDPIVARARLRTCADEDPTAGVRDVCRAALDPERAASPHQDSAGWIEFYLYAADRRRLRPGGRYLLVLPEGLIKAGVTDDNAFAREAPAGPGRFRVEDPASGMRGAR